METTKTSSSVIPTSELSVHFTGNDSLLCNYALCAFTYKGHAYRSAEQAYQVEKARFAGDSASAMGLLQVRDPPIAYLLGRKVRGLHAAQWDDVRLDRMQAVLEAKFRQDARAAASLLATGDAVLKYNDPRDTFWGISRTGNGNNYLGKILMRIRQGIQENPPGQPSSTMTS